MLKALHSEGLSSSQIGAQLGCTRNAVIGKVHRLKLPPSDQALRQRKGPRHRPRPRYVAHNPGGARVGVAGFPVLDIPEVITALPPSGADRAVTLREKGPNDCCALLDDCFADNGAQLYCGYTRGFDWKGNRSSYCPAHHALFYVRPRKDHAA